MTENNGRPVCVGDGIGISHTPTKFEVIQHDGEHFWKCPECEHMIDEAFGKWAGEYAEQGGFEQ